LRSADVDVSEIIKHVTACLDEFVQEAKDEDSE